MFVLAYLRTAHVPVTTDSRVSPFVEPDNSYAATAAVEDFSSPQQPQQQQHIFVGAEDIVERLAGGKRLNSSTGDSNAGVFYNRVGAIGRDLSVLMANILAEERMAASGRTRKNKNAEGATIADSLGEDGSGALIGAGDGAESNGLAVLDAFAASGVRALRYRKRVHDGIPIPSDDRIPLNSTRLGRR